MDSGFPVRNSFDHDRAKHYEELDQKVGAEGQVFDSNDKKQRGIKNKRLLNHDTYCNDIFFR